MNGRSLRNSSTRKSLHALQHDMMRAVGRVQIAKHVGDRSDPMQIDRGRIGRARLPLHQQPDLPLFAHRLLGRGDRARLADGDRNHRPRQKNHIGRRDDDEAIGEEQRALNAAGAGSGLPGMRPLRRKARGS